jgi:hypothetical protein
MDLKKSVIIKVPAGLLAHRQLKNGKYDKKISIGLG